MSSGTSSWLIIYNDQEIVTIGGIPGANSRHSCVTQQPGWESLTYALVLSSQNPWTLKAVTSFMNEPMYQTHIFSTIILSFCSFIAVN